MIISKTQKNHIDIATLVVVLILMVFSVGVVYSASSTWAQQHVGASGKLLGNHALKVMVGFFFLFVTMQVDYRILKKISKILLIGIAGLLVVTLGASVVKGASRWIFGIQPSEFARLALVIHLAALITKKKELVQDLNAGYIPLMFWILMITGLVFLQPAFSTGAMMFIVSMLLLYVGGVREKASRADARGVHPAPGWVHGECAIPDEARDGLPCQRAGGNMNMNHQVYQGILGFANGGIFGLGPGGSKQRDLFLPEPFGDFVFPIIGEEYGLIGTILVLLLFVIFFLRGLAIAKAARDEFGRLLALGITFSITLYAVMNAGVTLALLPTTGLPLPFISYGGSSMIVSCIAVGILLNISAQTDMHPRLAVETGQVRPQTPQQGPAVGEVY